MLGHPAPLDSHRHCVLQFTLHTCAYHSFVGQTRMQRRDKMQINTHSAVVRAPRTQTTRTRVARFLRRSKPARSHSLVGIHGSFVALSSVKRFSAERSVCTFQRYSLLIIIGDNRLSRHVSLCEETRVRTIFLVRCVFDYKWKLVSTRRCESFFFYSYRCTIFMRIRDRIFENLWRACSHMFDLILIINHFNMIQNFFNYKTSFYINSYYCMKSRISCIKCIFRIKVIKNDYRCDTPITKAWSIISFSLILKNVTLLKFNYSY